MANNTNVQVESLKPLQKIVLSLGLLPTSYLESMTYAELVMWFCKFLQEEVIPVINNHSEAITELQNWLNNLDLQEEVDNKLDAMVEAGTLQEIIADYLNSKAIFGFDNVESMKEATNLIDGSYAKTLGYYTKNDGGSSLYKIREITNEDIVDEMFIIALSDNSLIAELILTDTINPEQIGCLNNGTNDDSTFIQECIDKSKELGLKVTFGKNLYYIKSSINIPNLYSIDFQNITLQAIDTINEGMINVKEATNMHHGVLSNLILDQNNQAHIGIYVYHAYRRIYDHILTKNTPAGGYGILVDTPVNTTSGGNQFSYITGEGNIIGSTFICDKVADNVYNNIDYQQYTVGLEVYKFVRIYDFHGYVANVGTTDWYTDSIFIRTYANSKIVGDNLYPDTQNYIFYNSSLLPSIIGNIFYTHNSNTTLTNEIKFFYSTDDAVKDHIFYRWRIDNLCLDIPIGFNLSNFKLVYPRKNNLNSALTITNFTGPSNANVEKPLYYIPLSLGIENYTTAGFNDSSLILQGTCPYSVGGSIRKVAYFDSIVNYKIPEGVYSYTFTASDTNYRGFIQVSGNDINILPDANQTANFTFNICIPAKKINKTS